MSELPSSTRRVDRCDRLLMPVLAMLIVAQVATAQSADVPPVAEAGASTADAPKLPRPRLLLEPADIPRLQAACGLRVSGLTDAEGVVGQRAAEFNRLSQWMDANLELPLEDGSLYVPAFLHLMTGKQGVADKYTRCVERELKRRLTMVVDYDDAAVALDWCWESLDSTTRLVAAQRIFGDSTPFNDRDTPLEHVLFHPKLCSLAAAIAYEGEWPETRPEGRAVQRILAAARTYMDTTFIQYIHQLNGRAPVTSLQGDFEADVVLAAELWDRHEGGAFWPRIADVMRNSCDAYFWSETNWPGAYSGLVHDFGNDGPTAPGSGTSALARSVASVLAHRTRSPIAGWYARLSDPAQTGRTPRDINRLWMDIIHDTHGLPTADRLEAPLARNLGDGWILMRSDWRPGATVVAFDAGQPIWLSRQHYDAGQFQIWRRGRLALDSGDDVRIDAVPAKLGRQGIGDLELDFDRYATATVAHNCIAIVDPRDQLMWKRQNWPATGNQRLKDDDWRRVSEPIESTDRRTGRLLAFTTNRHFSYAASDIAPAYERRSLLIFDRHLLFFGGKFLVVADRIVTERSEVEPSWLLHLPSRPTIDGADLDSQFRRGSNTNAAGIWHYSPLHDWVSAVGGEGRIFSKTLLPVRSRSALIGGPQTVKTIEQGAMKGHSYVGSDESGFEYWVSHASDRNGKNAWYRLGNPNRLGAVFGIGAGWGRLEVTPQDSGTEHIFVHLIAATNSDETDPPEITSTVDGNTVTFNARIGTDSYEVFINPRGPEFGTVRVTDIQGAKHEYKLNASIAPKSDVPVERATDRGDVKR